MVNYKNKYLKYKLKYEKMLNGGMNKKKNNSQISDRNELRRKAAYNAHKAYLNRLDFNQKE